MGYLLHLLLAMGAIAAAEALGANGVALPAAALLLAPVPYALGRLSRRSALRGRWRAAASLDQAVRWSPPCLQLVATALFGWHAAALEFTGVRSALTGWPHPVLLVSLLPFAVYELAAIDARARLVDPRPDGAARLRRLQVRLLVSSVAPLLLFVLAAWLLGLPPRVRANVEQVAILNAALAAGLVAALVAFLPRVLRSAWDTVPLAPGRQRDAVEAIARRARFRCRELVEWRTGGLLANAAIVGVTPGTRVVMFSDALLAQLDLRQLGAVFAHEIGHARRRHIPIFGVWALFFFLTADASLGLLGATDEGWALAFAAGCLVVWALSFGWLSRRFELDADLYASDLLGEPEALVDALERVVGVHARRQASWRHFSTADRVLFLRANSRDPGVGRRLRRQLGRLTRAGVVLFALALAADTWALGRSFEEDRVRVDLALGRYTSAAARVESGAEVGGWTAALVARGAGLRGHDVELSALDGLGVDALARGDAEAALEWVALLSLRTDEDLAPVMQSLEAYLSGDAGGARRFARDAPGEWERALARFLESRS